MALIKLTDHGPILGASLGGGGGVAAPVGSYFVNDNATVTTVLSPAWTAFNFGSTGVLAVDNNQFVIDINGFGSLEYVGSAPVAGVMTAIATGLAASGTQAMDFRFNIDNVATPTNILTRKSFDSVLYDQVVMQEPIALVQGNVIRAQMRNLLNSVNMTFRTFMFRFDVSAGFASQTLVTDQTIVEVTGVYSALPTDDIVSCTGTFTVTLPHIASAVKQITIQSTAGTITIAGDATIQAPTSVSPGTSGTLFPAGGQWWHK